jgi:hypothetical protein
MKLGFRKEIKRFQEPFRKPARVGFGFWEFPLIYKGIPNSENPTALSGIPSKFGFWEKGNSGNPTARNRLHTLAAVIILTVRRLTGSNGNTPSLATPTLSGKSAETALASCQDPARRSGNPAPKPKHTYGNPEHNTDRSRPNHRQLPRKWPPSSARKLL